MLDHSTHKKVTPFPLDTVSLHELLQVDRGRPACLRCCLPPAPPGLCIANVVKFCSALNSIAYPLPSCAAAADHLLILLQAIVCCGMPDIRWASVNKQRTPCTSLALPALLTLCSRWGRQSLNKREACRDTRKGKAARVMGKDPAGGAFYADSPTLLCNPVDPAVALCFAAQEQQVRRELSIKDP